MRGNHHFPSQVVSDNEKSSHDYGLRVAQAIEAEWFDGERNGYNRYNNHLNLSLIHISEPTRPY